MLTQEKWKCDPLCAFLASCNDARVIPIFEYYFFRVDWEIVSAIGSMSDLNPYDS